MRQKFYSRLARKEEQKNFRNALVFGLLTVALLVAIFFFGVKALFKYSSLLDNLKNPSAISEVNDGFPPLPPKINYLSEFTNKESITLSGFSKPNSMVEVFLNQSSVGTTTTTSDGTFSFENLILSESQNEVYVVAIDQNEKKSPPSNRMSVFFDNIPPELEITQPQDGSVVAGERKRKIKVLGKMGEKGTMVINNRLIILDENGSFSAEFNLSEGDNIFKLVAKDLAGNQEEREIKVNFRP